MAGRLTQGRVGGAPVVLVDSDVDLDANDWEVFGTMHSHGELWTDDVPDSLRPEHRAIVVDGKLVIVDYERATEFGTRAASICDMLDRMLACNRGGEFDAEMQSALDTVQARIAALRPAA